MPHLDRYLAVAPMEGVMDNVMRQLLSEIGGMDYFVSEFVRVTQYAIPSSTFTKAIPENRNYGMTKECIPVHTQILGSNAELMAISALNAIDSGATHIDINFGCPAKRVNGHGGGSVLLQHPKELHNIVKTVRQGLPQHIKLSAKIRLGYEDEDNLFKNVEAIESGGADTLTIHGRTKRDGYKPPARWEKIAIIRQNSNMSIVANGDIEDKVSLEKCQLITGCNRFMIGRGALTNPFIFLELQLGDKNYTNDRNTLINLLLRYTDLLEGEYDKTGTLGRVKQWCGYLSKHFDFVAEHLKHIRTQQEIDLVRDAILKMK